MPIQGLIKTDVRSFSSFLRPKKTFNRIHLKFIHPSTVVLDSISCDKIFKAVFQISYLLPKVRKGLAVKQT